METRSTSPCFSTNWIVEHGSLENNLTFESSSFPIDEATEASPKDYLLLKPASPDSGPCEIKISFGQKHEIRQVYVRSTARVYEIYYAPYLQSGDEYLCTVRCGIVTKEDESCHASENGEAIIAKPMGSTEKLIEEKAKSEVTNSSNEDDWVDVKVPDCPSLDGKTNFQSKGTGHLGRTIQDMYEATAEISDGSPCISITLRLLSLQTKGSVHVEEIYVFADPVESTDSDQAVGPVDDSTRSSLVAMLVPTLLQLSKSGSGKMQDRRVSDIRDGVLKTTELSSGSIGNTVQQGEKSSSAAQLEMKIQEVTQANAESMKSNSSMGGQQEVKIQEDIHFTQLESGTQVLGTGQKYDSVTVENGSTCSRLDRVLDQLVCRIERLEMVCSRFEENMLKPLAGIETRLGRLEQQLEVFTMRSQPSRLYSCTRIAAPEFSCTESESNSFYNDGHENRGSEGLEIAKDDSHFDKPSSATDVAPVSVDVSQFPGLVITAPEFSNADDEEDDGDNLCDGKNSNEDFESARKDLPINKRVISIDDALASALSGFLSSAAVQPPQYTQTLVIKAPDFTNEEDGNDEKLESPVISCERGADPAFFVGEEIGIDDVTKTTAEGPLGQDEPYEDGTESNITIVGNGLDTQTKSGDESRRGKSGEGCPTDQLHKQGYEDHDPLLNFTFLGDQSPTNQTDDGSIHIVEGADAKNNLFIEHNDDQSLDSTTEGAIPCMDSITVREVQGAELSNSVLQNILDHTYIPVDFNLPLLEVEFIPLVNWNARSPLEALLNDTPATEAEVSCVRDEDIEVTELPPDIPDDFIVKDVPSNTEDEVPLTCSDKELPFTSLI
ncbi:uncharacterized protein LOC122641895 isoform X2 [Telopea speciosissima]|uniref:uncharacterized protein LOC122641895 isoform X2 n=1 Tax=Telopea speciosissima TaxID=54955 RepID=UPI001CC5865B|nr:uncharacterized protein LOC122641895 isoform X2 [Telopea speciosissima]